jgi:hypothetical protein
VLGSSDSKARRDDRGQPPARSDRRRHAAPKAPGAAETIALFKGIPQQLNVLGRAERPGDAWSSSPTSSARSAASTRLTRCRRSSTSTSGTGKAKFVFSGMHFIGPDSEKALRAVYAAGLQGPLWQYLDLLYKNQGGENAGWVTDDLLRSAGDSLPASTREDARRHDSARGHERASRSPTSRHRARGVNQTPTFFAGRTRRTLEHELSSLTADASGRRSTR